jgi:hypothetical protein
LVGRLTRTTYPSPNEVTERFRYVANGRLYSQFAILEQLDCRSDGLCQQLTTTGRKAIKVSFVVLGPVCRPASQLIDPLEIIIEAALSYR